MNIIPSVNPNCRRHKKYKHSRLYFLLLPRVEAEEEEEEEEDALATTTTTSSGTDAEEEGAAVAGLDGGSPMSSSSMRRTGVVLDDFSPEFSAWMPDFITASVSASDGKK